MVDTADMVDSFDSVADSSEIVDDSAYIVDDSVDIVDDSADMVDTVDVIEDSVNGGEIVAVTVSDTSDIVMDKVEELENTLVNSFSGDTAENSIELDTTAITDAMVLDNSVENLNTNSNNSAIVSTGEADENVESSSVKRRVNMKSKRKNSKHYNNSYHNSPYYPQYTTPPYQHTSNYNTSNYSTPNYSTPNYNTPNYANNYVGPIYPYGNFNKYYPTQYNNTAPGTAVNFNVNPNNSMNMTGVNAHNTGNVSSVVNKIQLLKNRQRSALQILNPHTGEVINSSTATTPHPVNTATPTTTEIPTTNIPTGNIEHDATMPSTMTNAVPTVVPTVMPSSIPSTITNAMTNTIPNTMTSSVSSTMTGSIPTTVPDTIPTAIPNAITNSIPNAMTNSIPDTMPTTIPNAVTSAIPSSNIVDMVDNAVTQDTVDLVEMAGENHITASISVASVDSVDNSDTVDNDSSVTMSLDWQENTPTQMAPPILLISVQSKPKTKIKNKPINPAEIILTLSELHPNPNISTHNSHSKSHSRKIYNVPAETGDGVIGDRVEPVVSKVDPLRIVKPVFGVDSEDSEDSVDIVDDSLVIVDTIKENNRLELPTTSPFGADTGDSLFDLGKTVNGNTVDIIADPVNINIKDSITKSMVEPVSLVVDVVEPPHTESKLESQGLDYSVDHLIRLSFGVFDVEIEDLGTFKIVPLNYVIRKKAKKTPQWRDISATNSINTVSSVNGVNGVSRMSKLDQLKRSIRTLLNKLTVENFLVVSEKIVAIYREMSLREEVEVLVDLLHEKGTTELEYADMYADLAFLLRYSYNDILDLGNKTTLFHKSLLNKCQDSFEQINSNASLDKSVILGSIRFMGELFLRKILSINILKRISNTLLFSRQTTNITSANSSGSSSEENLNSTSNTATNGVNIANNMNNSSATTSTDPTVNTAVETTETSTTTPPTSTSSTTTTATTDNTNNSVPPAAVQNVEGIENEPPMNLLECFVELLTTIGYTVEQIPGGVQMLDEYTGILIQLRNSGKYPTRINFKIQDLIDLRRRNWKLKLFKEKATSVSQIHKQVEQEQLTGSINSVEGKYITAGLQVNRHYTQFLLDKRQIAIDSLVNGVYTGSPPVAGGIPISILPHPSGGLVIPTGF
eukprot:XP_766149.1 hypothetical protein [Theileria parva strain Muguga]